MILAHCNENFLNLQGAYLFAKVKEKQEAYKAIHKDANIISLGIGDVTQPLAPVVIEAMTKAVKEMGQVETFHGYGPEEGYAFLREAIAKNDFQARGCAISPDEIFVSDGAKCDIGNIQEIFGLHDTVAVTDPVYPVYVDSQVMAGRSGRFVDGAFEKLEYLPCYEECGFKANLPVHDPLIIYLCSPNNPTGVALNRKDLTTWVKYAKQTGSIILFDAAYEAFIAENDIPHSIYEIDGAKEVAMEFRSYSKTAGFTGVRCGYVVIPKELQLETEKGEKVSARELWYRRQCTKFNGCSYIVQRGAEAVYSEIGKKQIQEIFGLHDTVAVTDPVYPVYVDSQVMAGRSGRFVDGAFEKLEYLPCYEECGFKANLPVHDPLIIYLCSPNNPTGVALNRKDLTTWVKYAKQTGSIILFDAAYEAFIAENDIPHSIYEIDGAKEVAMEFRSYSKTAGFTGVRCGYVVIPKELQLETEKGEKVSARELWYRRQCTKFNGCSYIVQRGAEAVYSEIGKKQIQDILEIYKENARIILEAVESVNLPAFGGKNSPYIWMAVPKGMSSWEFFDFLLENAEVICTPGSGFGPCGEGFVRLTSFNTPENTKIAVERLKKAIAGLER